MRSDNVLDVDGDMVIDLVKYSVPVVVFVVAVDYDDSEQTLN